MHLVDMVKNGQALPAVLPLDLIPPSYRGVVKRPVITSVPPALSLGMTLPAGESYARFFPLFTSIVVSLLTNERLTMLLLK
jgi:hypothetical protein